jgi:hypothetical protein
LIVIHDHQPSCLPRGVFGLMVIEQGSHDAAEMAAHDLPGLVGASSGDSGADRHMFTQ